MLERRSGRTLRAGFLDCTAVSDGNVPYPSPLLFANAAPGELERVLGDELDENGSITGRFNPLLVRGPDVVALVDTGFGSFSPAPGTGRLLEALRVEDVQPADVELVVVTHAHPDHLGGLIADGEPVFARARHVILAAEWDFWTAPSTHAPEPMIAAVDHALRPLHERGLLEPVAPWSEVAPGVRLLPAPGHTPGHAVLELGDPPAAIFLADAVLHEAGFEHPEWTAAIDADPDLAVETRRALVGRAADEELLVAAYHLDRVGRVVRRGEAFRFVSEDT